MTTWPAVPAPAKSQVGQGFPGLPQVIASGRDELRSSVR
ncbi:hypothetical protein KPATCC21470_0393 [Kitasatospora purpeofusca]